jgi:predicted transcriptional regulator
VKTAVSIPDSIFEAADRLARRRRVSRSALYAEALALLLAAESDDIAVTAQLNAVHAKLGGTLDPEISVANTTVLREEW